jgi:superfamily II DNA/RNA helicase
MHFHRFNVATLVGGTSKYQDRQKIWNGVDLLVCTPGRLEDHLNDTKGFSDMIWSTKVLVLDEADQMLELGFQPAITRIIGFLNPDRQTLLFSATVPKKVAEVATIAVKKDYVFLNCIPKDQQQTHAKVSQEVMITPIESTIHAIFQQIGVEVKKNPEHYKIMIFCVAAQFTAFMADLFRATNSIATVEMHSRKS